MTGQVRDGVLRRYLDASCPPIHCTSYLPASVVRVLEAPRGRGQAGAGVGACEHARACVCARRPRRQQPRQPTGVVRPSVVVP